MPPAEERLCTPGPEERRHCASSDRGLGGWAHLRMPPVAKLACVLMCTQVRGSAQPPPSLHATILATSRTLIVGIDRYPEARTLAVLGLACSPTAQYRDAGDRQGDCRHDSGPPEASGQGERYQGDR